VRCRSDFALTWSTTSRKRVCTWKMLRSAVADSVLPFIRRGSLFFDLKRGHDTQPPRARQLHSQLQPALLPLLRSVRVLAAYRMTRSPSLNPIAAIR
jgi:hypothetical protein